MSYRTQRIHERLHDLSIPFRAGERLRLSEQARYGLWLMSFEWDLGTGETVCLRLHPSGPAPAFLVEQQLMQHLLHLRDALGTPVQPVLARFAFPAPPHRSLYEQHFGCACVFDAERSELLFSAALLAAHAPRLAKPLAVATPRAARDGPLAEVDASPGFAGQVRRALHDLADPGAGMKAVAAALRTTDRTLRRRLADEGTTFSAIAHELRYCVAARHLEGSDASIDQIAGLAGYSDPANFRRAFIRWTRMSPAQFRGRRVA